MHAARARRAGYAGPAAEPGPGCDEAQWLSRECFELWRHLWDDRRTDIAIVFVGGGDCYRVLRREPMLSSRVYVWQEFRRLDASRSWP